MVIFHLIFSDIINIIYKSYYFTHSRVAIDMLDYKMVQFAIVAQHMGDMALEHVPKGVLIVRTKQIVG